MASKSMTAEDFVLKSPAKGELNEGKKRPRGSPNNSPSEEKKKKKNRKPSKSSPSSDELFGPISDDEMPSSPSGTITVEVDVHASIDSEQDANEEPTSQAPKHVDAFDENMASVASTSFNDKSDENMASVASTSFNDKSDENMASVASTSCNNIPNKNGKSSSAVDSPSDEDSENDDSENDDSDNDDGENDDLDNNGEHFNSNGHSRSEKRRHRRKFRQSHQQTGSSAKQRDVPRMFAKFPVIIKDRGTGSVRLASFQPWYDPIRIAGRAVNRDDVTTQRLKSGSFLVHCKNAEIQKRLSIQTKIGSVPVICSIPQPTTVGVVYNIPHGIESLHRLRNCMANAAAVERLKNKEGEDTKAVKVTFNMAVLPEFVHIGTSILPVSPFAAPVRRCTKCQRIGHSKQQCHSRKTVCSQCGSTEHARADCNKPKCCVNCGGNHSAAWAKCPTIDLHKRANEIRSTTYIPFAEAIRRAKEPQTLEDKSDPVPKVDNFWDSCISPPVPPMTQSYVAVVKQQAAVREQNNQSKKPEGSVLHQRTGKPVSTPKPKPPQSQNKSEKSAPAKVKPTSTKESIQNNSMVEDQTPSNEDSENCPIDIDFMQPSLISQGEEPTQSSVAIPDGKSEVCSFLENAPDTLLKARTEKDFDSLYEFVNKLLAAFILSQPASSSSADNSILKSLLIALASKL